MIRLVSLVVAVLITYSEVGSGKLQMKLHREKFTELERCVTKIVDKYIKRRKLMFLRDEVGESNGLGDQLLRELNRDRMIISSNGSEPQNGFFIFIVNENARIGSVETKYMNLFSKINVGNGRSKLLFIWYKRKSSILQDVQSVFQLLWSYQIIDVIAMVLGKYYAIRLYTYYPFTASHCFEAGSPVLIDDWDHRRGRFTNRAPLYSRKLKVRNLFGCKIRCMGIHRPPEAVIERMNDTWRLSGTGIKMFQFVKEYLNFSAEVAVNRPLNIQQREKLNETNCLTSQVAAGLVDLGFGKFTRLLDNEVGVTFAKEIQQDCFTWAVPHGIGYEPSIWNNYNSEFSKSTWCMVALSMMITVFFIPYLSKRVKNEKKIFRRMSYAVFFTYSSFIGATIKTKPRSFPLRVFVSNWFIFSLVMTSAYVAYLGSLVTVPPLEPELKTQKDLLSTSLNLGGRQQMFYILNSSAQSSSDIEQIITRFQILAPVPLFKHIKRVLIRRDLAVFGSRRELVHYAEKYRKETNNSDKMYIFPQCVTRSYSSPFIFRNGSPFLKPINDLLWRLFETGITLKWDGINKNQEQLQERIFTAETMLVLKQLYGALVILLGGYILAAVIFLIETISYSPSDITKDLTQNVRVPPRDEIWPFVN